MEAPEIQLFNAVFKLSLNRGYETVDYSPVKDEIPYPFVHVGETTDEDIINNKQVITGFVSQTIHVWGYANNRALHTAMMHSLKQDLRAMKRLINYRVELQSLNSNTIYDNTTNDNLLHGIIEVEYKLS
ncbi:hypothetical protein [Sediminibacillus massiliensis]|uniref:hypothetical protein n=1 Tax=Sediminibacillus massiliensis TaxID=1926277 RepID=UPI00098848E3|nr:hypothetical protein [Sediminibacillus massiliensis]